MAQTEHWMVRFRVMAPLEQVPRIAAISGETQTSSEYRHEGRFRQYEQQCIFKYTISGEGVFCDAHGEHRVSTGYGFLCRIRDPETAYYYPQDGIEPWRFVYASILGRSTHAIVSEIISRYGPIFKLPDNEGVIKRWLGYRRVADRAIDVMPADTIVMANDLIASLIRSREEAPGDDAAGLLVRKAEIFVRDNLEENINATDIARALSCSREHLSRVFREQTGQSPYRYLLREKMISACRLLKESNMSGKEISIRLGYASPEQFARTFKRIMHITPARFRAVGTIPVV